MTQCTLADAHVDRIGQGLVGRPWPPDLASLQHENEEIAEAMGLSLATVKCDWALARAWLQRALSAR